VALSVLYLGLGFQVLSVFVRINSVLLILRGTKYVPDEYIFTNKKVVYGPCPPCEMGNRVYFSDILVVEGFNDIASLKCRNCKVKFDA